MSYRLSSNFGFPLFVFFADWSSVALWSIVNDHRHVRKKQLLVNADNENGHRHEGSCYIGTRKIATMGTPCEYHEDVA